MTSKTKANLVTAGALVFAAAFMYFFVLKGGDVEGKLSAPGGWVFAPGRCWSGQRHGFFGVGLEDSKHWAQLLVIDDVQRGPSIQLRPAQGKAMTVTVGDCKGLSIHVERTGTVVNDVRSIEGTLGVDCPMEGLGRVTGHIEFSGCH